MKPAPGGRIDPSARVLGGNAVGRDVRVGAGAVVDGAMLADLGAVVGEGAVVANSVIGTGARRCAPGPRSGTR